MNGQDNAKWARLSVAFQQFGRNYRPDDLANLDWCVKQLAVLGYSTSITYVTRDWAKREFGREPNYPPGVDGLYTYQLWGPGDGHPSPLTDDINEAAAMAMFTVCRLDFLAPAAAADAPASERRPPD